MLEGQQERDKILEKVIEVFDFVKWGKGKRSIMVSFCFTGENHIGKVKIDNREPVLEINLD